MPSEYLPSAVETQSQFTQTADLAFDEFCKKYFNSKHGMFNSSLKNRSGRQSQPSKPIAHVKDIFSTTNASDVKTTTAASDNNVKKVFETFEKFNLSEFNGYSPSNVINEKPQINGHHSHVQQQKIEEPQVVKVSGNHNFNFDNFDYSKLFNGTGGGGGTNHNHNHHHHLNGHHKSEQKLNGHHHQHDHKDHHHRQTFFNDPPKTSKSSDALNILQQSPFTTYEPVNNYQNGVYSTPPMATTNDDILKNLGYNYTNTTTETNTTASVENNNQHMVITARPAPKQKEHSQHNRYDKNFKNHKNNRYSYSYTPKNDEANKPPNVVDTTDDGYDYVHGVRVKRQPKTQNGQHHHHHHVKEFTETKQQNGGHKVSEKAASQPVHYKSHYHLNGSTKIAPPAHKHNFSKHPSTAKFKMEFVNAKRYSCVEQQQQQQHQYDDYDDQFMSQHQSLNGLPTIGSTLNVDEIMGNIGNCGNRMARIGLKVVACGMQKGGRLPVPKANYFIDQGNFGDDAGFWSEIEGHSAIGLADGATGNIMLGYDPGDFPRNLMELCSNLFIQHGHLRDPKQLLMKAFDLLQDKTCYGSCTACVLTLDQEHQQLKVANIGDSGYRLVRNGRIVHKSEPQRLSLDCPRQIDSYPWKAETRAMGVSYTEIMGGDCACDTIAVQKDDLIILSSDGLYDNIEDHEIENIFNKSPNAIQAAEKMVYEAVKNYKKPDDVLIIVGKIVENKPISRHAISSKDVRQP